MINNVCWSCCEVRFILFRYYLNFTFLDRSLRNPQNIMKVLPVRAELFHADGRT